MICRRFSTAIQCSSRVTRNSQNAGLRAPHRFVTSLALSGAGSISRLGVFRPFLTNTPTTTTRRPFAVTYIAREMPSFPDHAHLPQRAFRMSHTGLAELIGAVTPISSAIRRKRAFMSAGRTSSSPRTRSSSSSTIHVTCSNCCIFGKWGSLRTGRFPSTCPSHRWTETGLWGVIRP